MAKRKPLGELAIALARTVSEVVKFAQALVALLIALGLGTAVVSFVRNQWPVFALSLGIILVATLLFASMRSLLQAVPVKRYPTKLWLREVVYQYFDRTHMRQIKDFVLEARVHGVDHFTDRYKWTGEGDEQLRVTSPGHALAGPRSEPAQFWMFYDVRFSPLSKGEKTRIRVEWDLYDEKVTAQPLLVTGVYEPTEVLVLRVILPRELAPQDVHFCVYPDFVETTPTEVYTGTYDRVTGEICWRVRKPMLKAKYAIIWSW